MKQDRNLAILAFVMLCLVWGTTYLGIKVAIDEHIPPFFLSAIRHIAAGMFFLILSLLRGKRLPDIRSIFKLAVIGFLMIVGGNGLVCWAEQFISSGLTAVICSLSPIFITVLSLLAFKNFSISWKIVVGLLISLFGIVCIFHESISFQRNYNSILGVVLLVFANLSWALGSIFMKKNQVSIDLFLGVGVQMILGGIMNLVISAGFEDIAIVSSISAAGWWATTYLIVVGSLLGYGSYIYVLSQYTPSRISLHTYINTIIAVFVGWMLGGESIDHFIFIGTAFVLLGVILVNREYSRMRFQKAE
ncbi:MAG: DMT family transporter [Saprospiraceae bacterium]